MKGKDLLSISDLTSERLKALIKSAIELKEGRWTSTLSGKSLALVFEKKGDLEGLTTAYVGDGNNVANSLMLASALAGMNFRIASPKGYAVVEKALNLAREYADDSGSEIFLTEDPKAAVRGADVICTDVWVSMGQEAEAQVRRKVFAGYQVNSDLLAFAREDAIIMHPMPAHRGEEVSADILDTEQSVVFDQAENRLHAQKALLAEMLGGLEILG